MLHFSVAFAVTFELICSIIQIRSDIQQIVNVRWFLLLNFEQNKRYKNNHGNVEYRESFSIIYSNFCHKKIKIDTVRIF